jgi:myo-inositol 2-dehydrogenase / D-chiro-inositol 1-dehydrogenase
MSSSAPRSDRVRVGIAGLGAVAQAVHLPLLRRLRDSFQIAAIADLSPSLRATIGEEHGIPAERRFASVGELMDAGGIDGLILLTSGSHGGDALAALARGIPILCEKPLAFTLTEADRLASAEHADRLLLGYMKVFDPAVVEAARILADDADQLGERRAVEVTILHPTSAGQLAFAHLLPPPRDVDPGVLATLRAASDDLVRAAIGPAADALGELYSGILLGSVVHELSVIRALGGEVAEIESVDAYADEGSEPGSVLLSGRLTDGSRLTIAWHYLPGYPAYREDVRVHHVGGSLELTFPAPYRLNEPTLLTVSTGLAETRRRVTFDSVGEAFEEELIAFHGLVRDGQRPRTGIADGREDIVTCQRAIARLAERRGIPVAGEAAEWTVALGPAPQRG